MLDGFISIPGPKFLGYFTIVALITVVAGWFKTRDDSLERRLPDLTGFDLYTVAALRGSYQVIHTALFNLWSRDLLVVEDDNEQEDPVLKSADSAKPAASPVESVILKEFQKPRRVSEVLQSPGLKESIDKKLEPVRAHLEKIRLLRTEEEMSQIRKVALAVCGILAVTGGLKLILGLTRHKPSFFLIIMLAAYILVAYLLLKPRPQTRLGKNYLDKLEEHFNWTRDSLKMGVNPKGLDPAWPVAIFGAGFLADVPKYNWFSPATKKSKNNWDTGCGGGCGSSCGGGCGSSCGGGCGGGCGGCGE